MYMLEIEKYEMYSFLNAFRSNSFQYFVQLYIDYKIKLFYLVKLTSGLESHKIIFQILN
jgi:hypothetical protein